MTETPTSKESLAPEQGTRTDTGSLDPASAIALVLTAVWLLGAAGVWIFMPNGAGAGFSGANWVMTLVAIVLPVALIWVAALMARAAHAIRNESARLTAAVDALRAASIAQGHGPVSGVRAPIEAKLEEIARAQRQAEAALARLAQQGGVVGRGAPIGAPPRSQRTAPERSVSPNQEAKQPQLALGTPSDPDPEPIPNAEFVRALNFPEDERDAEGFHALRLALKDHFSAGLVRSSQDVLTLLAEDGIYMDDLNPDRARPEVWRRFAQGERGKGVAALGGIRDRSCLTLTSGRMRQDPVFRDVAHHFLRKFDRTIAEFEPRASDAEIVALADTRTSRAFMLLGRVSGTFD